MFLVNVPRIFKIAVRASCGETTSKVACEISTFYNFVENSHSVIGMFLIVVLVEISKNSFLTRVASL